MKEGGGGERGQPEERMRGSRGPRSSQLSVLGFCGKADSERKIAGSLNHTIRVNNRKQFSVPLPGRNQSHSALPPFVCRLGRCS